MQMRKLGSSDVHVTPVVLGTWAIGGWLWGGQDDDDALAAIRAGLDAGMTTIDTAPIYGFGHSEEIVGKAIAGRRDEVQLLTKYGLRWDRTEGEFYFKTQDIEGHHYEVYRNAKPDSIVEECERSLKRLGTDCIDLYQCHWRDHTTPVEETMEAVEKLLKAGKIRAAGVSNFTVEEIQSARSGVPLASNQPPYSMVKRDIEREMVPYAQSNDLALIVYSPLQLGLLTGKLTMDREFPPSDLRSQSPYFKPENRRKVIDFLEKLAPIADGHHATVAQLVIHWTIHRPGVTAALVGSRNPDQARENAAAAGIELTDAERETIDGLVEGLHLDV